MANPRVEEISDSDPEEMDPANFDPDEIMRPANDSSGSAPRYAAMKGEVMAAPPGAGGMPPAGGDGAGMPRFQRPNPAEQARQREKFKRWQCLYPIYFDSSRSTRDGRRVARAQAVENPLAREIAEAASSLGYQVALDPGKMHPKDWANPGRVKVLFSDEGEIQDQSGSTKNKNHFFLKIAEWLREHPTTTQSPLKMPIAGLPANKPPAEPSVPRGRKISKILPMHSPALTGGGVSENMLKDMMAEMQNQGGGGGGLPPGMGGMQDMLAAAAQQGGGGQQTGGGGAASSGGSSSKKSKKNKK